MMNRDEVAQELQEHDILLHSSPGTGVAASATSLSGTGHNKVSGGNGGTAGAASTIWDVDYGSEEEEEEVKGLAK